MADQLTRINRMVEKAKERPISKAELQQQRTAFAFGNLPGKSSTTKEDVVRAVELMEGAS